MKFPSSIVLDFFDSYSKNSNKYWVQKFIFSFKSKFPKFFSFTFQKSFFLKKENLLFNKLMKNQKKYTISYISNFKDLNLNLILKNKNDSKIKNKDDYFYEILTKKKNKTFDIFFLKKKIFNFNNKKLKIFNFFNLQTDNRLTYLNLFDINFLRKEKIYTKLKYSRVPQYDTVSGGVAAIFAGFLGFLICEKFGFELLDSGDFYFLFMYLVFFFFFFRLYIKLINFEDLNWNVFSLKWFIYFYKNLFLTFFKLFKKKLNLNI